ncbi:MAG: DUF2207 domain-containing protein [Clostridia bacterium]|jgi:uncharacterized membrane protein|nr:DUF2207 domain-containing protein [Clostridia bacterium]
MHNKIVTQKVNPVLLFFLIFCVLILGLSLCSCQDFFLNKKGEVFLESLDTNAILTNDGKLQVEETWVINGNSEEVKRNLYKTIELQNPEYPTKVLAVTEFSVVDNASNKVLQDLGDGKFTEFLGEDSGGYIDSSKPGVLEIGLIMEEYYSGRRSYTFRYTLEGMLLRFLDCDEIYWNHIGPDFALFIENYNLNISLPIEIDSNSIKFWMHSENVSAYSTIVGNDIQFFATNINPESYIEVRSIWTDTIFDSLSYTENVENLVSIEEEELGWAIEWERRLKKEHAYFTLSWVIGIMLIITSFSLVIYSRIKYRKNKINIPYYREIPPEFSPAEYGHFFYYYSGGAEKPLYSGRLISSTILDFVRRHILTIEIIAEEKYIFNLSQVSSAQRAELLPHEATLLNILECISKIKSKGFSMDDLDQYARTNSTMFSKETKKVIVQSGLKLNSGEYIDRKQSLFIRIAGLGPVFFFAGIILLFVFFSYIWPLYIGLIISGILLIIGVPKKKILSKKGELIFANAKGLYNYMKDFSNLEEHEIPKIVLWEEFMVYATMMGISKEVLKALPIKLIESKEYGLNFSSRNLLMSFYFLSKGQGIDLGSNVIRSFSDTAQALRLFEAKNSGKSSFGGSGFGGGGFSGGGGGFGGGGGGIR